MTPKLLKVVLVGMGMLEKPRLFDNFVKTVCRNADHNHRSGLPNKID